MHYHAIIPHKDFTIGVTDSWTFYVEQLGQHFQSLGSAKEGIDAHLRTLEAEERAKANKALNISVLVDGSGEQATVTGINARTGALNGVKDESRVYPVVPWIRKALKAKAEAHARIHAINDQLRGLSLYHSAYGRLTAENYLARVERFKQEFATLEAKVAKAPVPEEWAEPVKESA